jgi:condensin complex subunit 1
MGASRRSSVPRVSSVFPSEAGAVSQFGDNAEDGMEGIQEEEEEEEEDGEDEEGEAVDEDDQETAVEDDAEFDGGEGEDFTQDFDPTGTMPNTPARTVHTAASTVIPRTPKTPARSRAFPMTPKTVKGEMKTPKPKKKKKKPRKSDALDLSALTNEQAALAALESSHILHLRLRKKYYAEGLAFIKQVEGAVDILSQLLVSTSKAEVLESMEFFRVAHEYQFESAHVS